jgi:hypothetical protein
MKLLFAILFFSSLSFAATKKAPYAVSFDGGTSWEIMQDFYLDDADFLNKTSVVNTKKLFYRRLDALEIDVDIKKQGK